jgi:flagellar basal-body rod modification protein FlgD
MEVSDLSALAMPPSAADAAQGQAELGRTDFLRMLVAQLENQDPLNPQDGTEFTAQLAQFSQLEQLISMRTSVDDLVKSLTGDGTSPGEELTRGLLMAGLIGKDVFYSGSEFEITPASAGAPPEANVRMAFDLDGNTSNVTLRIYKQSGVEVGTIDRGRLSQGQYELYWDGIFEDGTQLAPGTYSFQVDAKQGPEPVGSTTYVGGRVTGTSLNDGNPTLLLGNLQVPVSDVIEVRDGSVAP